MLLDRAADGDEEAFAGLFRAYRDKLFSFLMRLTESPEGAEDIIQDIFLRLWKDRAQLANVENFGGYLFRMARNQMINAVRRMARETVIFAEFRRSQGAADAHPEAALAVSEALQVLGAALDKLPPQQRLVYTLSREQGLSHEAIARQLNISSSTVNNHLVLALRVIRQHLGRYLSSCAGGFVLLGLFSAWRN